MAFRSLITKTALGVLGTTLLVLPARSSVHAGDATLQRQPEGQWKIKSVESTQDGKKPYCVMQQPLSKSGRLTFSRNHERQTAIALDLGKQLMSPSRNYTVTIQPNGGDKHRYDVTPLSPAEFIIRMGADSATFEQIRAAESLRVSVAGERFDMGLPDMKKAVRSLSECVEKMFASAKSTSTSQTMPREDREDNAGLPELRAENEELRQSLKETRRKLEEAQAQSGDNARVAELKEKVKALESKLAKARRAQKDAEQAASSANKNKLAKLRKQLSEVRAERQKAQKKITQLKDELSSLASAQHQEQDRLSELRTKNAELQQSLKETRRKMEEAQAQSGDNTRIAELKEKVKALESKLARSGSQQADESSKTRELARLRKKLSEVKEARQQAEKRINKLRKKLVATSEKLDQFKQKTKRLKEKVARLEKENSRMAQKQSQAEPEIAALRNKNRSLMQKLDKAQTRLSDRPAEQCTPRQNARVSQKQIEELRARISRLRKQNRRLKNDLGSAQTRLENVLAKDHDADAVKGGDKNLAIARRYHEAQREIRRLGSKLREKRQSCQKEVKELEEMLFNPRLAKSKQISVLNKLESRLKKARARIDELKSREGRLQTAGAVTSGAVASRDVQSSSVSPQQNKDKQLTEQAGIEGEDVTPSDKPINLKESSRQKSSGDKTSEAAIKRIANDLDTGRKIYTNKNELSSLLRHAGLGTNTQVEGLRQTGANVHSAYQWDHGSVYGSAKFRTIADKASFKEAVDKYIATARSRCPADFSARPAGDTIAGAKAVKLSAYDIACLGQDINNSASIVFMREANNFGVIAFESGADDFGTIMQYRDSVMQTLASAKTARR
jgi:chromosome segregation ATPase